MVLVFFVSAVAHEVAVGVPLHMVNFWAFAGIMLQVRMMAGGGGGGQRTVVHWLRVASVMAVAWVYMYLKVNNPLPGVAHGWQHVCILLQT